MKTTKTLFTLVILVSALTVHAQNTSKEVTDEFLETYTALPAMALKQAFFNPMCTAKTQEQKDALISRAEKFMDTYGWYISHEQIAEESIGESLKIFTYLVKYDCQPIELKLVVYKAKEEWTISNIYIDSFGN